MPTFKTQALHHISNVQLAQLAQTTFTVILMANTALPCSSLPVTNDALCY